MTQAARSTLTVLLAGVLLCIDPSAAIADPILDPIGDTFNMGVNTTPDITSINAVFSGSHLNFTVTFAGNIAPPSALAPTSIDGFIDIDTDKDAATFGAAFEAATGFRSNKSRFGQGASNLGIEYFIDLISEGTQPGMVDVTNAANFQPMATVPILFGPDFFSVSVPLSALGGDDGLVSYGVIVGELANVATDEATNPGQPVAMSTPGVLQPIPEPSSLLIWGFVALVASAAVRWRRLHTPPVDS